MIGHTINGVPARLFRKVRDAGSVQVVRGVEYVWEECANCGGSGHYPSLVDSGRCFYCRDSHDTPQGGRWVTKADHDRRAHNRELAAARRERKARELAERLPIMIAELVATHPLLAELTYLPDHSGFLGDLRQRLETKGRLSERQVAAAEEVIRQAFERQATVDATARPTTVVETPERVNAHFGAVGERLTVAGTVRGQREFHGDWGPRTRFAIDTERGTVVWWATGRYDSMRGETVTLTGTVKRHDTYQGERQTVLTRGRLS